MKPCTVCLGASWGDGLRQLATPNRYYDKYNEDLIFFVISIFLNPKLVCFERSLLPAGLHALFKENNIDFTQQFFLSNKNFLGGYYL